MRLYNETVGDSGAGAFNQSGGTNTVNGSLTLGVNAGGSGTYTLSGTGQLTTSWNEVVGASGTGTFTQSGGSNNVYQLYIANAAGGSGTYNLRGTGVLYGSNEYVGYSSMGTFNHSAGANTAAELYLGYNGGNGTYNLTGTGALTGSYQYVGYSGAGTFNQSGGTNTASTALYLGYNSGSNGTYNLSGTGQLSALAESIGYNSLANALFQQTGGVNTVTNLSIGPGGDYLLSGGTLVVSGNFANQGIFDGGSSRAAITANGLMDLTAGTWQNLGDTALTMGANSLLVIPAGFNPPSVFGSYSSAGLTYTPGTTLTVPAGKGFVGAYSFNDPVVCQGTITAASGQAINLNNGLLLSGRQCRPGERKPDRKRRRLRHRGRLAFRLQPIYRQRRNGAVHDSSGTSTLSNYLYLGYGSADHGTYNMSGDKLSAYAESVGVSPGPDFSQSGGTNTVSGNYLYLGQNAGSSGTYTLSEPPASCPRSYQYVARLGTGVFTQTGGTNSGN